MNARDEAIVTFAAGITEALKDVSDLLARELEKLEAEVVELRNDFRAHCNYEGAHKP